MSSTNELFSDEMECWENCYGERLILGAFVKATDYGENIESLEDYKTFMVTSLKFNDKQEVRIGLNNGSSTCTKTHKDNFGIADLQPA